MSVAPSRCCPVCHRHTAMRQCPVCWRAVKSTQPAGRGLIYGHNDKAAATCPASWHPYTITITGAAA